MPSARPGESLADEPGAMDKGAASLVVVDACFALKLVLPEDYSERVRQMWESWVKEGTDISAPYLLTYEVVSVLRNKVFRGELSPEEGEAAFLAIKAQGICLLHVEGLEQVAWNLAKKFDRPAAYDTTYLALAQILDCEFWTADAKLKNAVDGNVHRLRWVGDLPLSGSQNEE
jgi:predicted nucleic acid-binding protein